MAEVSTSSGVAATETDAGAGGRKVVIVGFMCAGKSRLGRLAAAELGHHAVRSDQIARLRHRRIVRGRRGQREVRSVTASVASRHISMSSLRRFIRHRN